MGRRVARVEIQVTIDLGFGEAGYTGCRKTADITNYEGVCTNVGDAGAGQHGEVISGSKIDISLGKGADFRNIFRASGTHRGAVLFHATRGALDLRIMGKSGMYEIRAGRHGDRIGDDRRYGFQIRIERQPHQVGQFLFQIGDRILQLPQSVLRLGNLRAHLVGLKFERHPAYDGGLRFHDS